MTTLLDAIHACNDHERELFGAERKPFSNTLARWHSDLRPWQENNNFFYPLAGLSADDLREAIALQKSRGLDYLMLRTSSPLPQSLQAEFKLEEDITYLMALTLDRSEAWQENTSVEIRDIQTHDISADLLDVRDVPEKYRAQALRNMEHVLSVARDTPNYHWLCGYVDGHKVANVYCLRHGDVMEMDDLWVDENFRGRYIATTLMKCIAQNFGGTLYLHAAANETPKDMYRKMGFETVETIYDYYLTF